MKKIPIILLVIIASIFVRYNALAQCVPSADNCASVLSITGLPATLDACTDIPFSLTPTINFPAPLTLENYSWSIAPVSNTESPGLALLGLTAVFNTPATSTNYCLTATALGPNVIANGDFESGNICFATGYVFDPSIAPTPPFPFHYLWEGRYNIRNNMTPYFGPGGAPACDFGDNTSGFGNMMIVNGSIATPTPAVWQQNVAVCPGASYRFSLFYANWSPPTSAPVLRVLINGVVMNATISNGACGVWRQLTFIWAAGGPAANIVIQDMNNSFASNDFVLDDISFRRVSTDTKCVTVIPRPAPVFTINPVPDVCSGSTFTLTSSYFVPPSGSSCPGCTLTWSWAGGPGASGDNISLSETVTDPMSKVYSLTVTDGFGCSATQSVVVNIFPTSDAGILTFPMIGNICSGTTVSVLRMGGMSGGTWSITGAPGVATVSPSGAVTFGTVLVPTTVTVNYTVGSGPCPPVTASITLTVFPRPVFGLPVSIDVCEGDPINICSTPTLPPPGTPGLPWFYAWSWGPTTAPCATHPPITMPGMSFVRSLTITNSFGCDATQSVILNVDSRPAPVIGSNPTPADWLCVGDQTFIVGFPNYSGSYVESWSSSNPSVATVTMVTPSGISPSGPIGSMANIVGVSAGTAIITYSVTATGTTTGCTGFATFMITVLPVPSPIVGPSTICEGNTHTYTSSTPGGVWAVSNPSVATITTDASGNGIVTGVSGGTVILYYYFSATDTRCPAKKVVTVIGKPKDICPSWHVDPVLGTVFDILGTPAGATVTYVGYNLAGGIMTMGTAVVPSMVPYTPGVSLFCITSVTYMGCPWPIDCCVRINDGSPRPAGNRLTTDAATTALSISPNPNTGTFTVSGSVAGMTANETVAIEIMDVLGRAIYTNDAQLNNGKLDMKVIISEDVANGTYLLKVKNSKANEVIRFTLNR